MRPRRRTTDLDRRQPGLVFSVLIVATNWLLILAAYMEWI